MGFNLADWDLEVRPDTLLSVGISSTVFVEDYEKVLETLTRLSGGTFKKKFLRRLMRRLTADFAIKYLGLDPSFCEWFVEVDGEILKSSGKYTPHPLIAELPDTYDEWLTELDCQVENSRPKIQIGGSRKKLTIKLYENFLLLLKLKNKNHPRTIYPGDLYRYFFCKLVEWLPRYELELMRAKQ